MASDWTELPRGKDVNAKGGYYYTAIAAVKRSHAAADIHTLLAQHGLQEQQYIDDYQGESNPEGSNYRIVVVTVYAPKDAGVLPWGVPSPLSLVDSSHLMRVYAAPAKLNLPPVPPPPPAAPTPWAEIVFGVIGVSAAAGFGWWWLRQRKAAR